MNDNQNNQKQLIIYKITNLKNGMIYIGKDSHNNPNYLGSGDLIIRAIKKYGKENFKKEIICKCNTLKQLNNKEKYYIKFYKSLNKKIGYNIASGGDGGDLYSNNPNYDKIVKKLSKINKIIQNTPKMKKIHSETAKRINADPKRKLLQKIIITKINKRKDVREKRSKKLKGRIIYWKNKISKTHKKLWNNEEKRKRQSLIMKKIWNRPGHKEKMCKIQKNIQKEIQNRPEVKLKISNSFRKTIKLRKSKEIKK